MTPLETAIREIGVTEYPRNSNNVKYNTEFYGQEVHDGLWNTTFPWCMAFVQWCFKHAGYQLPYKTASCSGLLNWYKKNKPERIVTAPKANDIAIFNFGHTGIVESVKGQYVTCIEGNTSASDASNGGEVMRATRKLSQVSGFIRPYDFEEENDMTGEEIYTRLNNYLANVPLPEWAKKEYEEAKAMGITDGSAPMVLIPRYQAAIMAKRAAKGEKA